MDLESLNNKELRVKCLQYGLPNVPVADSNRKILIRRLRKAMENGPIETPPPVPTTVKTQKKTNRRATVHDVSTAVTTTTTVADDFAVPKLPHSPRSRNRNTRRTVTCAIDTSVSPSPTRRDIEPADRVKPIVINRKTNHYRTADVSPSPPRSPPQLERSISLSKTGVLTTSYNQETVPIRKHVEFMEVDVDEDEYDEDEYEEEDTIPAPIINTAKLNFVKPYCKFPMEPQITRNPRETEVAAPTLYPSLDSLRYNDISPTSPPIRQYNTSTSFNTSNTTTASYKPLAAYDLKNNDDYEDEDEVSNYEPIETPFLSKFTRHLENLKAEPIAGGNVIPRNSSVHHYERPASAVYDAPRRRRPMEKEVIDEVDSPLKEFVTALERKYHLKQSLTLVSVFVLSAFVYVFFIQTT